jgi:uncharacterized protein YkwD/uncharacterized membrane protein required for colicin V production
MFSLNGNWVDLIVIVILVYYATEVLRYGLWVILSDFLSFLGSIIIAFKTYPFTSGLLKSNFDLPASVANALGFIIAAILFQTVLKYLISYLIGKLPKKILKNKYNKLLSLLPAIGEGLIVVGFLLTVFLALPVNPGIKKDISESRIGSLILKGTGGVETAFKNIFGGVVDDALTHLTIRPGSRETVKLNTKIATLTIDEVSESGMLALVNEERKKHGLGELSWNPSVVPVARAHARDMWERNYFSHYSPEGEDVGDRLSKAGVRYFVAGENLALAPTLQTAHTGLMNSEGHRENILNPSFKKIGIGVIDNGYYGKMFVQVFTD